MMKVNVYRNLKRIPSVLSIRCAVSGLVLGHAKHCELIDAKFVVQPSGQLRTRKEQQKNVHAWVVGTLDSVTDYLPNKKRDLSPDVTNQDPDGLEFVRQLREGSQDLFTEILYDPYKNDTYITKSSQEEILAAKSVSIFQDGAVFAQNTVTICKDKIFKVGLTTTQVIMQ